ncbi:MAG TPA: shikimate dehydrogenase [Usitatibacter sp.]|nr:shikimate dehydrogenase [Usitatibacter sp.]
MDRYVVIGNPVAHSLSPAIHARFAALMHESIEYSTLAAPLDAFAATARAFFADGGRGANVTLPFKVEAFALAVHASDAARLAGAANFLMREGERIVADNTDGAGLVADLTRNLGLALEGKRIAMLGAGGAARGVIAPLLQLAPRALVIANRTRERAEALATHFAHLGPIEASGLALEGQEPFDLIVNATSTSTHGEPLRLPDGIAVASTWVYDMAYGPAARAFVEHARSQGARASDGLGMLVEQAAESYRLWRGRRPPTREVLAELRARAS